MAEDLVPCPRCRLDQSPGTKWCYLCMDDDQKLTARRGSPEYEARDNSVPAWVAMQYVLLRGRNPWR
jgi:hypothetical protein